MNVVFSKKNGLMITSLLKQRAGQFALCVENRSLDRHYRAKHARLSEWQGQLCT